jgi:hypothetical protein
VTRDPRRGREGEEPEETIAIRARVRAGELRVDRSPTVVIHRGRLRVRRRGVPAEGAAPGVTYREVEYVVDLTDTDADPAGRGRRG